MYFGGHKFHGDNDENVLFLQFLSLVGIVLRARNSEIYIKKLVFYFCIIRIRVLHCMA